MTRRSPSLIDSRVLWLIGATAGAAIIALTPFHHTLSYLGWRYLHIMSASAFSGVVGISALFEYLALRRGELSLISAYHRLVQKLDKTVITMSMTVLLISAIALLKYQGYELWSIQEWPLWASSALVLISLNGLFWMIFDITNQDELSALLHEIESAEQSHTRDLSTPLYASPLFDSMRVVLRRRGRVNLISVCVLPVMYYLMVFKPSLAWPIP